MTPAMTILEKRRKDKATPPVILEETDTYIKYYYKDSNLIFQALKRPSFIPILFKRTKI